MKPFLLAILLSISISGSAQLLNWSAPIDVAPSTFGNNYPRIVNNEKGDVFVSWGANDNIYFSRYSNNSFTTAKQVNDSCTPAYTADWTGADIAVNGDTIFIVFMHKIWKQKSYIVRSFDGGQAFSSPALLENYTDSNSRFPTVDILPNGQPIVAYMKMDTNSHDPHYVFKRSNDYGNTFVDEKTVIDSGSEACDCCPAAIKSNGTSIAVFYRNNLNNVRNIYAGVSQNNGATFLPFAIDNNNWTISSCPATGPDGIIIGDSLYSVFRYLNKSFLSSSSMSNQSLSSVTQLGSSQGSNQQHYPRIDNDGNRTAIVWRQIIGLNRLLVSYSDNILTTPFTYDTILTQNFAAVDVAISADVIHIVYQNIVIGTIKYIRGTKWPSSINTKNNNQDFNIYPNPAKKRIDLLCGKPIQNIQLFNSFGQRILNKPNSKSLDISTLPIGIYYLQIETRDGNIGNRAFSKY